VEHPAYGLETSFAARVGSGGPEVVICAEYDALPGVGQACGHNIIAAAALGAGYALASIADDMGFRVTVLGTPAEEKYGGKIDLIEAGAFESASAAMMIHPTPTDVVDPNVIAIAELDVHFHGKTAHASAYPHLGVNALDAFVQGYVNISTLRQQLLPTDKVHGIVVEGGEAPNIIPDYTRSSWYVRAQTRDRLDELMARVAACFEGAAAATGCTVEVEPIGHVYDELISNPTMVDLFEANARALGRKMARGSELPPSQAGSTDMGNVSRVVPTIHPMVGIDSHPAVNHQAEFAAHTITPSGELAIRDGALAMAWTVIDLAERDLWSRL
jgi:amidohydrolase